MKILVTGGAGFIGSHVVDAYVQAGHWVTVLDNLSTGKRAHVHPRARLVKADIRSPRWAHHFRGERFDVINHHAAQIDVRQSVGDPQNDADINILGLLNVLEWARSTRVPKFIFSASGGTYYGECRRPARESDRACPLSPYGVSKLSSEYYLQAYRALHGLRPTVLRYGNVYGPRQDPHGEAGVVAIFCRRLLAREPIFIFGNGRQSRDYVFVKDVAQANVAALRRGDGESMNIGTGRAASVNELFRILRRCHSGPSSSIQKPARPGELFRSVLNVSKAARVLKWRAQTGLEDGLRQTYEALALSPALQRKGPIAELWAPGALMRGKGSIS